MTDQKKIPDATNQKADPLTEHSPDSGGPAANQEINGLYANSKHLPQNDIQMAEMCRMYAEQGDTHSQHTLGILYADGKGVPQDFVQAIKWFRKAAEQGYARAQFSLGLKYANGEGVTQDYAQAVEWYRKAAEQGYALAQCYLGLMYSKGRGAPQSDEQAFEWYQKAAEQGLPEAQKYLVSRRIEAAGTDPICDLAWQKTTVALDGKRSGAIDPTRQAEHRESKKSPVVSELPPVQPASANAFHPEGCIHRTDRGDWVRSKSEVIIANMLHQLGLDYRYEYPLEGAIVPGVRRPDFAFFDRDGKPLVWEHLGMLDDAQYRAKWQKKQDWYERNNFTQGINFFITRDEADGSLDSQKIRKIATYIKSLV